MENQEFNSGSFNKNSSPKPIRLNTIFGPLILNYVVSFLVQIVFYTVIMTGVMTNYIYASSEYDTLMAEMETAQTSEIKESIDALMTDEVIDGILVETIDIVENNIAILTICTALASIPVFAWLMYRDKKKRLTMMKNVMMQGMANQKASYQETTNQEITDQEVTEPKGMVYVIERRPMPMVAYALLMMGSVTLCIVANNLINLSNLATVSQAYQESSNSLYSIGFVAQIIGLGMITPIAEEFLFRGVIYKRLRNYLKPAMAIFWSALLFGVYHGNVVQLIYAFVCGVMLAWAYEKFGTIKAPILAHICMNITSLVLSQYNLFLWMFEDPIRLTVVTVGASSLMATSYVLFVNMMRNEVAEK